MFNWLYSWAYNKKFSSFKDKIVSLFKKNTSKNCVWEKKKLSKPKSQNLTNLFTLKKKEKIKDRIIRDIWTSFETEEEEKERKKLEGKKRN